MSPSQELIDFIARCEGFREAAYRPLPTDRWTVGYGCTYINGRPVGPDDCVSQERALKLLMKNLEELAVVVSQPGLVANLLQKQFDAVLSLVYNIGFGAFKNSKTSRLFYAGHDISNRFELFNKSRGTVVPGLIHRRLLEKDIYVNGEYGRSL